MHPAVRGAFLLILAGRGLCAAPAAKPLPAEGPRWTEARSEHVFFYSQCSDEKTRELAGRFETLRKIFPFISPDLARSWTRMSSPLPTHVFLFKDMASFAPYRPDPHVGGFFSARATGNFAALPAGDEEGLAVASHEFVHFVVSQNIRTLPLWLNEGLAEYYSTLQRKGVQVRVGIPPRSSLAYFVNGSPMPLERLCAVTQESPAFKDGATRHQVYASAWLFVHDLLTEDPARRALTGQFLLRLKRGEPWPEAFRAAYGRDPAAFEEEVQAHLRRIRAVGQTPVWDFTFGALDVDNRFEARPMAYPDVLGRLGLLAQTHYQDPAYATRHFEAALARDPGCGPALLGLGLEARDAGREEASWPFFDKAAQALPGDATAQLLEGASRLSRARLEVRPGGKAGTGPELDAAREALLRSLKLHPGNPEAIHRLCDVYEMDADRTEEGVEILAKARQARPDLAYLAWRLARLQAQAHRPALAIPLLQEVEALDPGLARQARAYREDLEDRQAKDRYNDRIRALQGPPGPQDLADLQALIATVHNERQRKAMQDHLAMASAQASGAAGR
jgi:tetratricopeptide (TPR) repeat protein